LILTQTFQLNAGHESHTAGGPFPCGNTGGPLFRFLKGGHTHSSVHVSLYHCMNVCRLRYCTAVGNLRSSDTLYSKARPCFATSLLHRNSVYTQALFKWTISDEIFESWGCNQDRQFAARNYVTGECRV
jgi:hypothetical protein